MTETLSAEDVLLVHEVLVRDFSRAEDPISPSGLRDLGLLESAVGRQHVAFGGRQKYTSSLESAATLAYGLCNNHPFHNGNKRTALVSMLAHLDKNGLALVDTQQKDLFNLIMAVATHSVGAFSPGRDRKVRGTKRPRKSSQSPSPRRPDPDEEVGALARWLEERARKPRRGEKQITYRELGRILRRFGLELCVPSGARGNHRDVVREEVHTGGLLALVGQKTRIRRKRIGSIGYRDEGTFVAIGDLKKVRELCSLREEDGVDSAAFYDAESVIDAFVNRYRGVLRRLSKR